MSVLTPANQLTLTRVMLAPAFVILTVYGYFGWALIVFAVAGLTDLFDGLLARKMGSRNYPAFVEGSFQCFAETARALKRPALEKHIDAMKGRLKELAGLQKAHREFLLDLQSVA